MNNIARFCVVLNLTDPLASFFGVIFSASVELNAY